MPQLDELRKQVERQALLFVLPVIGGAYLGQWLDSLATEYSTRWTLSLILLGIIVGALNVYLFIRE